MAGVPATTNNCQLGEDCSGWYTDQYIVLYTLYILISCCHLDTVLKLPVIFAIGFAAVLLVSVALIVFTIIIAR